MSTSSHLRDFVVKSDPSNDLHESATEHELQRARDALIEQHAAVHSILYAVEQLVREAPHMRDVAERARRACVDVLTLSVAAEAALDRA